MPKINETTWQLNFCMFCATRTTSDDKVCSKCGQSVLHTVTPSFWNGHKENAQMNYDDACEHLKKLQLHTVKNEKFIKSCELKIDVFGIELQALAK